MRAGTRCYSREEPYARLLALTPNEHHGIRLPGGSAPSGPAPGALRSSPKLSRASLRSGYQFIITTNNQTIRR
eukprot:13959798-Alexandrium_andersonii.AAC.1